MGKRFGRADREQKVLYYKVKEKYRRLLGRGERELLTRAGRGFESYGEMWNLVKGVGGKKYIFRFLESLLCY